MSSKQNVFNFNDYEKITTTHNHNKISGVYKITSPSGKCYIGQSVDIMARFKQHKDSARRGSKNKFYDAIKKYGINNFTFDILAKNLDTKIERYSVEVYYISFFNSLDNGYNMTKGGDGNCLKGELNGMYGRTHTDEVKKRLSDTHIGKGTGSDNSWHASNRTKEELEIRGKKSRDNRISNFLSLSNEEQDYIRVQRGNSIRGYYESLTAIERIEKAAIVSEKIRISMNSKSQEEIDIINSKKVHKGESNGRATFYILTNPEGTQYIVSMSKGLKDFCEDHNLAYYALHKYKNINIEINRPNNGDVLFKTDNEYKTKRINTIGWKIQQCKRIKI